MKIKVFFLCLLINVSFTRKNYIYFVLNPKRFVDVFTGNDLPVYESHMNILK